MPDSITVATINLRNRADRWEERRHLLVAQLVDAAPDLIALQELSFPIGQGRWLRNQINNRLTGGSRAPYQLVQRRKRHWYHGYFEGVGLLTKLPVLYSDALNLGYGGRVALRAHVQLPSRKTADFVVVHLHHVSHDRQARLEQVMQLLGWLRARQHTPRQIVAGDFNELPDGPAIQAMKQTFRSVFDEVWGHEPLATFPTALVPVRSDWTGCLDYIFVSPAVGPVQSARIFCQQPDPDDPTLYPSDHVGLLARLGNLGSLH